VKIIIIKAAAASHTAREGFSADFTGSCASVFCSQAGCAGAKSVFGTGLIITGSPQFLQNLALERNKYPHFEQFIDNIISFIKNYKLYFHYTTIKLNSQEI